MKTFDEYAAHHHLSDDPNRILRTVASYLNVKADAMECKRPYPKKSIQRLREAARVVWSIQFDQMND